MKRYIYIICIVWLMVCGYIYFGYHNTLSHKLYTLTKYYQPASKYISATIDNTEYIPPKKVDPDYIGLKIVDQARQQIWVVTHYDNWYYAWWYPPSDRGACSDVIVQTVKWLSYDIKTKLDQDMKQNPQDYNNSYDANINFRRVTNIDIYMSKFATKLSSDIGSWWFEDWLPGDIVVYDRMNWPKWLWHIVIISDKVSSNWVPYIIHNYWNGTVENDLLLKWPAPIISRYRLNKRFNYK